MLANDEYWMGFCGRSKVPIARISLKCVRVVGGCGGGGAAAASGTVTRLKWN